MADTSDFRNGMVIELDGTLFSILYFQHVKPGKGGAFVRTKLKNLKSGGTKERTFDSKARVEQAMIDKQQMEYLYREGDNFIFMNPETYDQIPIHKDSMKALLPWLKENTVCDFKICDEEIISLSLPDHMVFQVVETTPWVKGSTAAGGYKPATIDTGTVIQVPVYLNQEEYVRVDTRTGKYLDRAKGPEG
jgi:elongation factor P